MFNKERKWEGEKVILTTRPNFLLGNGGVLLSCVLLGVLMYFYPVVRNNVARFATSSRIINFPLVSWVTDLFLILGLCIIIYMIYKIAYWSTFKYTITSARVTVSSGLIKINKSSMPYKTIQDIQIDQGIIGRLVGIGSVLLFSAYDGTNLELKQITDPQEVEELIFSQIQQDIARNEPISPLHNQYNEENYQNSQYQQNNINNQQQYQQSPNMGNSNENYQQQYQQSPNMGNSNENYQQNIESSGGFNYTTNTYSINREGNYQNINEESKTYTDEEFNDSINEAIKNLNGNIKFQKQEPSPEYSQQEHIKTELNYQKPQETIDNNQPHNLFDDSIRESYADDKTQYYHEEKDYSNEEEKGNVLERHSSKFNSYRSKK